MKKEIIKNKYAVIWKRDKILLSLYRMKKTKILKNEWISTTGEKEIFTSCMIFETKREANNWRGRMKDWEIVKCSISF